MYKQISYIHLTIGYILQKYIKTDVECSRNFIAESLFLNPNLLPDIDHLILVKKNTVTLVRIFVGIKVTELGSLFKNNFSDQNRPKPINAAVISPEENS